MTNQTYIKNNSESTHTIKFDTSVNDLLKQILSSAKELCNADAGTIYLKKDNYLYFYLVENDSLCDLNDKKMLEIGRTKFLDLKNDSGYVAVDAAINKKIINVEDVYASKEYDFLGIKEFDAKLNYKSHSMIVVPIVEKKTKEVICVLQLINKHDNEGLFKAFTKDDEKLIKILGELSSFTISKIQSYIDSLLFYNERLQDVNNELISLNEKLEEKVYQRTKELERLTKTDFLTGINNRRVFFEEGIEKFNSKEIVHVAIVDIDKFKDINDIHGHNAGDKVLKSFCNVVRNTILDDVLFARIGGEEFALMYVDYDRDEVLKNIDEIKQKIELNKIDIGEKYINITASFGVAKKYVTDENLDDVMCRADLALYKSKDDGRNTINFRQ